MLPFVPRKEKEIIFSSLSKFSDKKISNFSHIWFREKKGEI